MACEVQHDNTDGKNIISNKQQKLNSFNLTTFNVTRIQKIVYADNVKYLLSEHHLSTSIKLIYQAFRRLKAT